MNIINFFSKHRFSLLTGLLLYLLSTTNSYSQQTTINQTVNNVVIQMTGLVNIQTCSSNSISIVMTNNSGALITNFDFAFLNNTKIDILYSDLINPNITNDILNNKITINSLQIGEVFTFNVPIRANCSNFNDATNTTVAGSLTIRPATISASDFIFNFTINSGFLEYISLDDYTTDNITYKGHKGDTFTRRYNMQNTSGNPYTGAIYIEEDITDNIAISNLILRVNGVDINNIVNPVIDPVTKKMIYTFNLNNVATGSVVELLENITITGCPISEGKLILKHGCPNDICKELVGVSSNFNLEIIRGPETPILIWKDLAPIDYNTCLSNNNAITKSFKLTNNGSAYAENISINFSALISPGSNNLMLIPDNSFSFSVSDPSITLTPIINQLQTIDFIQNQLLPNNGTMEYNNCFSPTTNIISNKTYTINKLLPGQSVTFSYSPTICCLKKGVTTNIIAEEGFNDASYDDECNSNTYLGITSGNGGSINPGMSQFPISLVNNMFGCKDCGGAPGCFGNPAGNCLDATLNNPSAAIDFTEEIRIKSTGIDITNNFPIDLRKFRIAIDVAADGRLMLAPPGVTTNPIGNIILVDSKDVTYTPVLQTILTEATVTDLFGTTDFPTAGPDNYIGARVFFEFDFTQIFDGTDISNFDTYGYKYLNYDKLNKFLGSLEIRFEVSGKCDRSAINTGPSNYFEKMYLQPNSDCQDCLLPIGELSNIIIVNCPGCVFPGMLTSKYEVERVTVGFNDGDNNGLPDDIGTIQPGTTVNNNANLQMVTDNDIFRTTTSSTFWGGSIVTYGSGSDFGSLENQPGFAHRFLNNMCRLDIFSAYKDIFSVLIDPTHPVTVDYVRNGIPLFSVSFTDNTNNIYTTNNNGSFLLQFPADLIRTKIGDPSFNYEATDVFEITCFYKVTGTFDLGTGKFYKTVDIANRNFFSGNSDPSNFIYKDINNTNEADPASPYGISGSLADPTLLTPSLNYICEAYGSGILLADLKEDFQYGYNSNWYADEPCYKQVGMTYGVSCEVATRVRQNSQLDLFPFEVRNFSRATNFSFIVPNGFTLDLNKSVISSQFSHRNTNDYNYTTFTQNNTLADLSDVTVTSSAYTDIIKNISGKLYKCSYIFDEQSNYFANSFDDQGYPIGSGKYKYYNEFVDQEISIVVIPDCNNNSLAGSAFIDANNTTGDINNYNQYGWNIYPGYTVSINEFDNSTNTFNTTNLNTISSSVASTGYSSSTGGNIDIVKIQPNIFISKKNQTIPFKIILEKNTEKVFVYFTSNNNQFQFGQMLNTTSNIVIDKDITSNIYELGDLNGATSVEFEIETSYFCNSNVFTIHYGYDCSDYPILNTTTNTLDITPCKINQTDIAVTLTPSDIEISYNTSLGSVPCDEIIHTLKLKPLGPGDIYFDQNTNNTPIDISVTLPGNLTYIVGTTVLTAYNIDGSIMQYGDPGNLQKIQYNLPDNLMTNTGNIYSWNISGYPDLNNIDINSNTGYFALSFKTDPTCQFNGGIINANVHMQSYCLDDINKSLSPNYNLIFNQNCSPVSLTINCPSKMCIGNNSTNISYQITSSTSTSGTYHLSWEINAVQVLVKDITINTFPFSATENFNLNTYNGNTNITLNITSIDGCITSNGVTVQVNPKPIVSINTLPSEYCLNTTPILLTGIPAGGTFTGNGVTVVGLPATYHFTTTTSGIHAIAYSYTDPVTTCSNTTTASITASPCCKYILGDAQALCDGQTLCIPITAIRTVNNGIIGMDFTLKYNETLMEPTGKATIGNVVLNSSIANVSTNMASYSLTYNKPIIITSATPPQPNQRYLHGSIFYTGSAPANANFAGTGEVICIEFQFKRGPVGTTYSNILEAGDMVVNDFEQGFIDEEYELSTVRACMDDNGVSIISVIKDNLLHGKIMFHDQNNVNSWLKYDPLNPSSYLITTIKPSNVTVTPFSCVPSATTFTTPDLNGNFSLDMTGENGLKISRDIVGDYYSGASCTNPSAVIDGSTNTSVMATINGYDSYLMESITTFRNPGDVFYVSDRKVPGALTAINANSKFPTPYQMIAADVNMTNSVRANDITLVQQRIVAHICEYPQVWNYTQGTDPTKFPVNAPDSRSLDWRFTDNTPNETTDFTRSSGYPNAPATSNTGQYYRDDLPKVPNCLSTPPALGSTTCVSFPNVKNIYAILLGDIDGSWRGNTDGHQQNLKVAQTASTTSSTVILDYANMQQTGASTYRIPVNFSSNDTTVSVDFRLDYDETNLKVISIGKLAAAEDADARKLYNDHNNQEILFTSYSMIGFGIKNTLYYIDFASVYGDMTPQYLGHGEGYLNGQRVDLVLNGATTTGLLDQLGTNGYGFEVIPNPITGSGNIIYNLKADDDARIVVYNAIGQIVLEFNSVKGIGKFEVNASELASGMYQVVLYKGDTDRLSRKMVIQK